MLPDPKRTLSMELDEMIPVDQFFEDYLNRLQSSALSEDINPYAVGGVHRAPSNIPLDAISGPEAKMQSAEVYGGSSEAPMNYTNFMEPPPSQSFAAEAVGSNTQQGGVFLDPTYFDERPSQGFNAPFTAGESMGNFSGAPFAEGLPTYGHPGDSTDTSAVGYSTKKGRHKSARQQQLNKLAQQRYRERKKAKALGLEQTVNALTEQLSQLSTVKQEKLALEEKNLLLEKKLIEKEAELQTVRIQLEEARRGAGNNTEMSSVVKDERVVKEVGVDSRPAKLFHKKVKDLQKYLKNNNLDPSYLVNPLDDSIPKKAVDDIYHLVGDVCMTCMQLTRHDGPDLWDLITASLDSKQRESHDRVMWRSIARSLKLGKEQMNSALNLREQHLAKLEKIFIQRQTLNLEAIQHLLPADQGGRAPVATPLGCLNIATFVQRLRHTAKLNTVLDKLKDNLSKEQKLNSELEYMTFYRVMSPLQGAWFTVSAYPHQCDCLEFLNAVQDLYGSQQEVQDESMNEN